MLAYLTAGGAGARCAGGRACDAAPPQAATALALVAAMIYDRRARRRGLRPGVSERDVLKRDGDLGL
jgi:hypothetical protein